MCSHKQLNIFDSECLTNITIMNVFSDMKINQCNQYTTDFMNT